MFSLQITYSGRGPRVLYCAHKPASVLIVLEHVHIGPSSHATDHREYFQSSFGTTVVAEIHHKHSAGK